MVSTILKLARTTIMIWRFDSMYKQGMSMAKGIGVGMVAGAAVTALGVRAMNNKKKSGTGMKKTVGRAMHTVGSIIGDVEKMLR